MLKLDEVSLSKFRIFETTQFQSDLEKLPKKMKTMIENKLKAYVYPQLSQEPSCGLNIKKLKNYTPATWRYRIGNYRIFYQIDETESIVFILSVDLRKDAY
ncbi:MAG: type II toxin-antitoxin system RelE/ParE family toxin [Leptospiraceae bacterium]|nr:type II toxin-antitoxin system RelE/ParE family toxin [Leptospiraceae bacterium]